MTAKGDNSSSVFSFAQLLFQIALTGNCNKEDILHYIKKAKKNYKRAKQLGHVKSEGYYNLTKSLLNESVITDVNQFIKRAFDGLHQLNIDDFPKSFKIGDIELPLNPFEIRYQDIKDQKLFDFIIHFYKKTENVDEKKEDHPKGKIYIPKIDPSSKHIGKVSVNLYQSMELNSLHKLLFFISQESLPQKIFNNIDKLVRSIGGVRKEINRCITDDLNNLYTFYFFSSLDSLFEAYSHIFDIINRNHIEKYFPTQTFGSIISSLIDVYNSDMGNDPMMLMGTLLKIVRKNNVPTFLPLSLFGVENKEEEDKDHSSHLHFDESLFPTDKLEVLIKYLNI